MTASDGSKKFQSTEGSLVGNFALSVISKVSNSPGKHTNRRIELGTRLLYNAVMDDNGFDEDQVAADLQSYRISLNDIIDFCIPGVALKLGDGWVDDTMSFTKVTTAASRLYGLCKSIGREWDGARPQLNSRAILLATVERETHIIGPAVLAEQLRRRGHSVKSFPNGTAPQIAEMIATGRFDGLMISASSLIVLAQTKKAIKTLKEQKIGVPIILGGACLGMDTDELTNTGADLVTNDIDEALDEMSGDAFSLRVAE